MVFPINKDLQPHLQKEIYAHELISQLSSVLYHHAFVLISTLYSQKNLCVYGYVWLGCHSVIIRWLVGTLMEKGGSPGWGLDGFSEEGDTRMGLSCMERTWEFLVKSHERSSRHPAADSVRCHSGVLGCMLFWLSLSKHLFLVWGIIYFPSLAGRQSSPLTSTTTERPVAIAAGVGVSNSIYCFARLPVHSRMWYVAHSGAT